MYYVISLLDGGAYAMQMTAMPIEEENISDPESSIFVKAGTFKVVAEYPQNDSGLDHALMMLRGMITQKDSALRLPAQHGFGNWPDSPGWSAN